ncbi:cytochrome P450, partial [Macroventuria anomochaeta]
LFAIVSCASIGCYLIYMLFVRQLISPYRHLPTAKQPSLWRRLFHEPTPFELRYWMQETPNNGLVRFFGFLNQERLFITSAGTMKQVLQKDAQKYDKLPWLGNLQSAVGVSGLVSSKGDLHKLHRKVTIGAFNDLSTRILYPEIWTSILKIVTDVPKLIADCSTIKVNLLLQLACLEISLHAGFGIDIDILRDPQQPIAQNYLRPFQLGERSSLYMKLLHICPVALQLPAVALISKLMGVNVWRMRTLLIRNQDDGRTEANESHDIMNGLLRRGYNRLSERVLMRHLMTTMAANTEMVSNQLSWAIYALSHPDNLHVQTRLRNEIHASFPNPPATMSWETMHCQNYLLGVVNEILRLYPNVGHRGRVVNADTMLDNLHLSKGTILVWPVYATNRDPRQWGPDADIFKPERWNPAESVDKETKRWNAFSFMTFGQGLRKCPGESYTRVVMASMLMGLIGRFEFRRPD